MDLHRLHDRAVELATLHEAWQRAGAGNPQLAVVYGRRRVGKTFLIRHFLEEIGASHAVYFSATQQSEAAELRRLTDTFRAQLGEDVLPEWAPFPSWEIALDHMARLSEDRPLTVVIDEVPYLTHSTPGFASIVQALWDRISMRAGASRLFLILTGSAVRVIEGLLDPRGPLFGRPTCTSASTPSTCRQPPRSFPVSAERTPFRHTPPAEAIHCTFGRGTRRSPFGRTSWRWQARPPACSSSTAPPCWKARSTRPAT